MIATGKKCYFIIQTERDHHIYWTLRCKWPDGAETENVYRSKEGAEAAKAERERQDQEHEA
jgi:hypothetical protein